MVELPKDEFKQSDLEEWYRLKAELAAVKAKEMLLRTKIFKACFPAPKEGTNNYDLPDGYVLKAQYALNRDVDLAAFTVLKPVFMEHGIAADKLVRYKAELAKAEYNKLTEEERNIVDQMLVIKPGSPALEIVLPKKRGTLNN